MSPIIKEWSDKIYAVDKVKFSRLIVWIHAAERTYRPEVIGDALKQFYQQCYKVDSHWWGYLDRVLDQVEGKFNARQSQAEHYAIKQAEADYAKALK